MSKPQIIYEHDKPAFVVIPYAEYMAMMKNQANTAKEDDDDEYIPFVLSDYIDNPIKIARIEAGLSQQDFASLLGVTQGYVSRIEGHSFKVSDKLLHRVREAIKNK